MPSPRRYAGYSIVASLITLVMKFGAWWMTDSVGLLSDAAESLVNVTAATLAFGALTVAMRPADEDHHYGHGKAEYFSSGAEGILIIVAAGGIIFAAIDRFMNPAPIQSLGIGLLLALGSSGVNFVTARVMLKAARRYDSITLEADAKHLLTDVWTSAGLVSGLGILLVAPPSWAVLDPIIAMIMGLHIIHTGWHLITRSVSGLIDSALPEKEIVIIQLAIDAYTDANTTYHKLKTRKSGAVRFIEFHLLLSGEMSVKASHDICCLIEQAIRHELPQSVITIHVEPVEEQGWYAASSHNVPQGAE